MKMLLEIILDFILLYWIIEEILINNKKISDLVYDIYIIYKVK